nr:MAG TPA: hypothetical protein [Caudoviricetes sp.]
MPFQEPWLLPRKKSQRTPGQEKVPNGTTYTYCGLTLS